jgi:hypothetical protein
VTDIDAAFASLIGEDVPPICGEQFGGPGPCNLPATPECHRFGHGMIFGVIRIDKYIIWGHIPQIDGDTVTDARGVLLVNDEGRLCCRYMSGNLIFEDGSLKSVSLTIEPPEQTTAMCGCGVLPAHSFRKWRWCRARYFLYLLFVEPLEAYRMVPLFAHPKRESQILDGIDLVNFAIVALLVTFVHC